MLWKTGKTALFVLSPTWKGHFRPRHSLTLYVCFCVSVQLPYIMWILVYLTVRVPPSSITECIHVLWLYLLCIYFRICIFVSVCVISVCVCVYVRVSWLRGNSNETSLLAYLYCDYSTLPVCFKSIVSLSFSLYVCVCVCPCIYLRTASVSVSVSVCVCFCVFVPLQLNYETSLRMRFNGASVRRPRFLSMAR